MFTIKEDELVIYQADDEPVKFEVRIHKDSMWLSLNQLSILFGRDKSVISRHLNNIFNQEELDRNETVAKFATVQLEGKNTVERQIEYYNLDAILSVGYRVNSKKGTSFRKWATGVLKEYLINGYSINQQILEKKLSNLRNTVELLTTTLINQNLVSDTGRELINLVSAYSKTWDMLVKYDEQDLTIPDNLHSGSEKTKFTYDQAINAINEFKQALNIHNKLFGFERDTNLKAIIGNIYQTFDKKDLYPSVEEKAANLFYLVIKDHPFNDGNKRIGSLLFLLFLKENKLDIADITPNTIIALALLIAESNREQKELIIKLIINLIGK